MIVIRKIKTIYSRGVEFDAKKFGGGDRVDGLAD